MFTLGPVLETTPLVSDAAPLSLSSVSHGTLDLEVVRNFAEIYPTVNEETRGEMNEYAASREIPSDLLFEFVCLSGKGSKSRMLKKVTQLDIRKNRRNVLLHRSSRRLLGGLPRRNTNCSFG